MVNITLLPSVRITSRHHQMYVKVCAEKKVAGTAYDRFIKLAEDAGDKASSMFFSQSRDVEETHAKLYKEAMDHLIEQRQTTYYVCKVCGYVSDGVLPDTCPVCGAGKKQFISFD